LKKLRIFTATVLAVCMLLSIGTTAFADYNGTGTGNVGNSGDTWMGVARDSFPPPPGRGGV
jgi:hypothetical protein